MLKKTLEECLKLKQDLLDTKKDLKNQKWKPVYAIKRNDFNSNRRYALTIADFWLEKVETRIKEYEKKKDE